MRVDNYNRNSGLTWIEALVVIAILFILAGMIVPCFGNHGGREKARRATCLNNLKQIGLALRLYAEEQAGEFPCDPARTTLGSFAMLTNRYQPSYKTWICPSDPFVASGSPTTPFTTNNLSYAYGGFGMKAKV